MQQKKVTVYLRIFAMMLLIISGLNWLSIGLHGNNFLEKLIPQSLLNTVYIIIGIAAIYIAFNRNTYLPFLGWSVFPGDLVPLSQPSDTTISVYVPNMKDAQKIVYWATNPGETDDDPYIAYEDSDNAGVVLAQGDQIELKLRCPKNYKIYKQGRPLPKHVHYRYILKNNVISDIFTINVKC